MVVFLSIGDDDDGIIGAAPIVPAQGSVSVQRDVPIQATEHFRPMSLHRLMCSHKPTCTHKLKSHLNLLHMVEGMCLPEGITSSWPCMRDQQALIVLLVRSRRLVVPSHLNWPKSYHLLSVLWRLWEWLAEIHMPMATIQEVAPDVAAAISEPEVVIVTGIGTSAIASPPVMIPKMATPPCSLTTGLVSSHKFSPIFSFQPFFCSRPYVMGRI